MLRIVALSSHLPWYAKTRSVMPVPSWRAPTRATYECVQVKSGAVDVGDLELVVA